MIPFCGLCFALFFKIDKRLLLRWNQRPPQLGDQTMRITLSVMPYAAILRICISMWMYSGDVLSSQISASASVGGISTDSYSNILGGAVSTAEAQGLPSFVIIILEKIGKPTVFPLFILLVITLTYNFLDAVWDKLPIYYLIKFIGCILKLGKNDSKVYATADNVDMPKDKEGNVIQQKYIKPYEIQKMGHELRQEVAPFTGEYYKFLKDKNEIPPFECCTMFKGNRNAELLSPAEMEDDWEIADRGEYLMKIKPWNQTVTIGGQSRIKGDPKRTYEIINEHGCSSYSLNKIPAYKLAVQGLLQGIKSMMDDLEEGRKPTSLKDKYNKKKYDDANPEPEVNIWANTDEDYSHNNKKKKEEKGEYDTSDEEGDDDDNDGYDDEEGDDDSDGSGLY